MTYLNAALTLMMHLLIHIDQVHNTLCWWFVINKTCFLHFSFLNLHLGVFSVPFRDAFCETGRADYKPRCSDRRLYLTSLSLSYFQLSLFHFQLWYEFHFLLSFFSVFGGVVAGREGQITNPDAQIGAHYHSQPQLKQPGENKKIFSRIISALLCFLMELLAKVLIWPHLKSSTFQGLVSLKFSYGVNVNYCPPIFLT